MDISGVALDGLNRAGVQLEKAATRVATFGTDSTGGANADTVDLSADMVALMSAETGFSANLKAVEATGEDQKRLIDSMA